MMQEVLMDGEKQKGRNERVAELADTLKKIGYKIRKLEFLIDDNAHDEETASEAGLPFVSLTLSV